ncbi:LOW QUALITY PROTEIN: MORN repeat-containing protein 1 [Morus bassanus]
MTFNSGRGGGPGLGRRHFPSASRLGVPGAASPAWAWAWAWSQPGPAPRCRDEGQDELVFKDGSYYEGKFVNGEITGHGFQYWVSTGEPICPSKLLQKRISPVSAYSCTGSTYSGQFVFGKLRGHNILQYKDGGKHEGEFLCGMREGKNQDNYEGAWTLDECQGHGILPCAVGTVYEGQWRNDVFNEQGAAVDCSGDICDGPWINGYPAACGGFGRNRGGAGVSVQPIKRTTVEQIFTLQPMEDPTPGGYFLKELQHVESPRRSTFPDRNGGSWRTYTGAGEKSVNSRRLEIWAGLRNHQIPSSATNLFELIEETERKTVNSCDNSLCQNCKYSTIKVSFDICCIWELKSTVSVISNSGFAWADLPIPKGEEPESGSDTLYGAGDASSSQRDSSHLCFWREMLANSQNTLGITSADGKGGKEPSGRISAEKAEMMTVSQEKMEDSRSHVPSKEYKLQKDQHLIKNSKTLQGQYVLMVHEVTMPSFLGQTLPRAFKLLIFPEKTKSKNKDSFKVTSK